MPSKVAHNQPKVFLFSIANLLKTSPNLIFCSIHTFDTFLTGLVRNVCTALKSFKLVQQNRQQALSAYCPYIWMYSERRWPYMWPASRNATLLFYTTSTCEQSKTVSSEWRTHSLELGLSKVRELRNQLAPHVEGQFAVHKNFVLWKQKLEEYMFLDLLFFHFWLQFSIFTEVFQSQNWKRICLRYLVRRW